MAEETNHVWAIAYIDRSLLKNVESDLVNYDYTEIECYIPTVKILKKKFKGKAQFEFQPLLFNYGFFKIPYELACIPDYLMTLRYRIGCIYGWVKDPSTALTTIPHLREDNESSNQALSEEEFMNDEDLSKMYKNLPQCALAKEKEIRVLKNAEDKMSIFCKEDIDRIKKGDYIILQTYPWEGIRAKILNISHKTKEVKVELDMDTAMRKVTVSFDNVFYTVYKHHDVDKDPKEGYLEDIKNRSKTGSIDRIIHKMTY